MTFQKGYTPWNKGKGRTEEEIRFKCNERQREWTRQNPNYKKQWKLENPEKVKKQNKQDYQTMMIKKPWYASYKHAKDRCLNKNNHKYYRYGERGIKFLMTKKDFEFLWIRDKADDMKSPTIDRKDNDGNYIFGNCRFIERSYNSKLRFMK